MTLRPVSRRADRDSPGATAIGASEVTHDGPSSSAFAPDAASQVAVPVPSSNRQYPTSPASRPVRVECRPAWMSCAASATDQIRTSSSRPAKPPAGAPNAATAVGLGTAVPKALDANWICPFTYTCSCPAAYVTARWFHSPDARIGGVVTSWKVWPSPNPTRRVCGSGSQIDGPDDFGSPAQVSSARSPVAAPSGASQPE